MEIDKKELIKLVKSEAELLKIHATISEKKRLKYTRIVPMLSHRCIYGLLTGDCFSQRATDLLKLCAVPYSSKVRSSHHSFYLIDTNEKFMDGEFRWFSPIEFGIVEFKEQGWARKIVDFILGKSDQLELIE